VTPPPAAAGTVPRPRTAEPSRPARRRAPGAPPPRPRRVSGPTRRPAGGRPPRGRSPGRANVAVALLAALEGLSPRALVALASKQRARARPTQAVLGRAWIGVVAFALIGIVTLQLGLLKLNAGIGRALEHAALLQRENAALSVENSEMAASDRVQARAGRLGMEIIPPTALRFLTASARTDATRGAAVLSAAPGGSSTGSGAAPSGSGTTASQSASAPATEAPTTSASPAATEASTPASATAPAATEHGAPAAAEPKPASAESTTPSAPSAPTSPSAVTPAGGGSTEATPAGGTQSGASG
jgi:hypothetical protein